MISYRYEHIRSCELIRKSVYINFDMFSLVFLITFSYLIKIQVNCDKRLLVNDQDAINSKFLNLERRLNELETENNKLKNLFHVGDGAYGTTYIRWGRKDCPSLNGTELVYTGIAGGSAYGDKGSGSNMLCLPHDPDPAPSNFPSSLEGAGMVARVWGAEYQFTYGNVAIEDDIPCAVCRVNFASSTIMVPGKSSCPKGWQVQYNGLLCADYHGYSASEYVCLDGDPQYFEGRRQNLNGKLFYPAVAVCGSLPCPPYINGKYMTCARCSK